MLCSAYIIVAQNFKITQQVLTQKVITDVVLKKTAPLYRKGPFISTKKIELKLGYNGQGQLYYFVQRLDSIRQTTNVYYYNYEPYLFLTKTEVIEKDTVKYEIGNKTLLINDSTQFNGLFLQYDADDELNWYLNALFDKSVNLQRYDVTGRETYWIKEINGSHIFSASIKSSFLANVFISYAIATDQTDSLTGSVVMEKYNYDFNRYIKQGILKDYFNTYSSEGVTGRSLIFNSKTKKWVKKLKRKKPGSIELFLFNNLGLQLNIIDPKHSW